jgi:uncharacterized protein YlxW (UPF0749 family)
MKIINKIMVGMFTCLALSSTLVECFYNDGGYPNGMLTGAAIGGLAGGRRGAAIGLGVGAATDMISASARNNERRRRDENYDRRDRDKHSHNRSRKSMEQENTELLNENSELRRRIRQLEDENAGLAARLEDCLRKNNQRAATAT